MKKVVNSFCCYGFFLAFKKFSGPKVCFLLCLLFRLYYILLKKVAHAVKAVKSGVTGDFQGRGEGDVPFYTSQFFLNRVAYLTYSRRLRIT